MLSMRVTVKRDDTAKAAERIHDRTGDMVNTLALDIQAQVQNNIVTMRAVDSGNLLNSWGTTMLGPTTALVASGVEYGPYVNYGTAYMPARPFADQALEWGRARAAELARGLVD